MAIVSRKTIAILTYEPWGLVVHKIVYLCSANKGQTFELLKKLQI